MGFRVNLLFPLLGLTLHNSVMRSLVLALALALPVAAQQTVTVLPDVGSLYVYDSSSKLVGGFTPAAASGPSGANVDGIIRLEVLGEGTLYLPVARLNGKILWNTASPYYTSPDCTGTAHAAFTRSIADLIALVGPTGQLYIGDADAPVNVRSFSFNSKASIDLEGKAICEQTGMGTTYAVELREVANMNVLFPPPLSLEPGGKVRAVGGR
jgi:hypothetical protein